MVATGASAAAPADFVGAQTSEYAVTGNEHPLRTAAGLEQGRVGLARTWFWWSEMEVARGVYDFSHYDRVVADAAANNVRLLPILVDAPWWRQGRPDDPAPGKYPPADNDDMAAFAAIIAARYGPQGAFWDLRPDLPRIAIRSWQVWNEPNLWPWWAPWPDPAAYVALLRSAKGGLESCDPAAEVVAAGLPNSHDRLGPKLAPYLDGMYRAGARGSFDTMAIHPYGNPLANVYAQIEEARAVMSRHGDDAPLWVTEVGWGDGGPPDQLRVTSDQQAALVSQLVDDLHARRHSLGIRGVVYYQWADVTPPSPSAERLWHHIGLIDRYNQPKPAVAALRATVDRLELASQTPDAPGPLPESCPHAVKRVAATPTPLRSDGVPATQAASVDAMLGAGKGGRIADVQESGGAGAPPGAPARPLVSAARVRPAAFAPARRGPTAARAGRCARPRACPGGVLTFKASHAGRVEIRIQRAARGRRAAKPSPAVKLEARRGRNAFRLTGRVRGRALPAGPHRVLVRLVVPGGTSSEVVAARFSVRR